MFFKSYRVAHVAVEDYNYDKEDDKNEEIFEESLASSIPGPNDACAFNLEIKNVLKKV